VFPEGITHAHSQPHRIRLLTHLGDYFEGILCVMQMAGGFEDSVSKPTPPERSYSAWVALCVSIARLVSGSFCLWQVLPLVAKPIRPHIRSMTSGTQIPVIFSCPKCGVYYQATQEQRPDKHFGSFKCEDCKAEVHAWSGIYDYFDWKAKKMGPLVWANKM
jgi:hypothetical protein